jgi:hypothetical protein
MGSSSHMRVEFEAGSNLKLAENSESGRGPLNTPRFHF